VSGARAGPQDTAACRQRCAHAGLAQPALLSALVPHLVNGGRRQAGEGHSVQDGPPALLQCGMGTGVQRPVGASLAVARRVLGTRQVLGTGVRTHQPLPLSCHRQCQRVCGERHDVLSGRSQGAPGQHQIVTPLQVKAKPPSAKAPPGWLVQDARACGRETGFVAALPLQSPPANPHPFFNRFNLHGFVKPLGTGLPCCLRARD
jgi:hypothetical protein